MARPSIPRKEAMEGKKEGGYRKKYSRKKGGKEVNVTR
jgi:hypothetical protein